MNCPICSGEVEAALVSYSVSRNGYHLIIDDVPAFKCTQCGEPMYPEEAVDLVQDMLRELDSRRFKLDELRLAA
ncbi:MAG: YgiT-type zinc finger protein [Chloroflexi bacterium]|nr:YgiT-type zinc finger protein [Chloroflexota bacterium]